MSLMIRKIFVCCHCEAGWFWTVRYPQPGVRSPGTQQTEHSQGVTATCRDLRHEASQHTEHFRWLLFAVTSAMPCRLWLASASWIWFMFDGSANNQNPLFAFNSNSCSNLNIVCLLHYYHHHFWTFPIPGYFFKNLLCWILHNLLMLINSLN